MCGIMGYIGKPTREQKYWFLTEGLSKLEVRGRDATGIFSRETALMKAPISASEFLKEVHVKRFIKRVVSVDKTDVVFGHVRQWTSGDPSNNDNNHPIFTDKLVLIHNGMVNSKKVAGYKYKGQTDTEELLSFIDSSSEIKEEDQVIEGINNVSGSLSIAVYFRKSGNTYLYRHNNPLYVGKLGNSVLFSSTAGILMNSVKQFKEASFFRGVEIQKVPEDILFKVKRGDLSYISKVSPKSYIYTPNTTYYGKRYGYWSKGKYYSYPDEEETSLFSGLGTVDKKEATIHSLPETTDTDEDGTDFPPDPTRRVKQVVRKIGDLGDGSKFNVKHKRHNYTFTRYNDEYPPLGKDSYSLLIEVGVKDRPTVSRSMNYAAFSISKPELIEDIEDVFYSELNPFDRGDFHIIGIVK